MLPAAAAAAVKQVDLTTRLEAKADARVAEAKSAEEVLATSIGDAVTENARTRSKLEQAASEVEAARKKLDRLAPAALPKQRRRWLWNEELDFEQEVSMGEVFELDSPTKMAASAVEKLSDRDLNEVRKLPKPPELVRRALELGQRAAGDFEELQQLTCRAKFLGGSSRKLIARDDFIRRVLAMHPRALPQAPKLLDELAELPPISGACCRISARESGFAQPRPQHPDGARPAKGSAHKGERQGGCWRWPEPCLRRRRPASPRASHRPLRSGGDYRGGHGGRGGGRGRRRPQRLRPP